MLIVLTTIMEALNKTSNALLSPPADGHFSHNAQRIAGFQPTPGEPPRPSNSLISTAVQPAVPSNPHASQQGHTSRVQRANSVASQSRAPLPGRRRGVSPRGGGTQASVYAGQGSGGAGGAALGIPVDMGQLAEQVSSAVLLLYCHSCTAFLNSS